MIISLITQINFSITPLTWSRQSGFFIKALDYSEHHVCIRLTGSTIVPCLEWQPVSLVSCGVSQPAYALKIRHLAGLSLLSPATYTLYRYLKPRNTLGKKALILITLETARTTDNLLDRVSLW